MSGARAAASSGNAAATTVAPLVELLRRALEMQKLQRMERSLELTERAVDLAQRTLPRNSLIVAWMLDNVFNLRARGNEFREVSACVARQAEIYANACASDPRLKAMLRDRVMACCARYEDGTLSTPTPEERAFFSTLSMLPLKSCIPLPERLGEEILLTATTDMYRDVCMMEKIAVQDLAVFMAGVRGTLHMHCRSMREESWSHGCKSARPCLTCSPP